MQPPSTPPGALQPLQGLTKILRALTFAGHLAHPHQSVEVALCSICDTWKHGSIGHQIKGAELKRSLQPSPTGPAHPREVSLGMGNKEQQAEMDTRQEKKEALWSQLEETDEATQTHLKCNETKECRHSPLQ